MDKTSKPESNKLEASLPQKYRCGFAQVQDGPQPQ